MLRQKSLSGEVLEIPDNIHSVCCKACLNAKQKQCHCKCNGKYHGLGSMKVIEDQWDKLLPEDEAEEFRKHFDSRKTKCFCGQDLARASIFYYVPHPGGYTIKNEKETVWLYVKCKCGNDKALWKFGVERER